MRTKLGLLPLALLALGVGLAQAGVIHVPGDYATIYAAVQADRTADHSDPPQTSPPPDQ